jgi:Uma2 family endonuclease
MNPLTSATMTAEEFFDWCNRPENRDRRFELQRGKVVEMSRPGERHGVVCANVTRLLGNYIFQRRKGYVCSHDTGVLWEHDPDTVRGPDVFLYEKSRRYDDLNVKYSEEIPQLVAEVLSPNDGWTKVMRRVNQFLDRGVPVVWVIDPEDRTATVLRPGEFPRVLEESEELTGEPAFADLRVRVGDFFFVPEG